MIIHISLYHDLFSAVPSAQDASPLPEDAPQRALAACQVLSDIEKGVIPLPEKLSMPLEDKVARKRLYLAMYLEPLRGLTYTEKSKTLPLTDTVVRDSIKVSLISIVVGHRVWQLTRQYFSSYPATTVPSSITYKLHARSYP